MDVLLALMIEKHALNAKEACTIWVTMENVKSDIMDASIGR